MVYFPMSDADQGLSRAQIFRQIEASLKRLRVEYVDLYQCHRYDAVTPLDGTMSALSEVVRQGKARYIGFSEWSPEQIAAAFALPDVERFVSSQPQYSMLWRQVEKESFPCAARNKFRKLSGRRSLRAFSPVNILRMRPRPPGPGPAAIPWGNLSSDGPNLTS
jgi:aryl-alcohol dehydrogenase-like predicted oxidoreductase